MTKSGPPTRLEPSEYEAIEQAMMETSRGRWFLAQFAEKNRRQDTQVVLEAISKLETSIAGARAQPEAERIKSDLVEMSKAIERTRHEIANLKLPEDDGGNLVGATEELDAIVSATERATTKILQAAEDIQETAWTIREDGHEAPCARIDNDVTDIYTACSFQDITGQRTQKVVQVLRYLESRINAMVSIWGLEKGEDCIPTADDITLSQPQNRPDAHLLNGPQMEDEALQQGHVDDVFATTQAEDSSRIAINEANDAAEFSSLEEQPPIAETHETEITESVEAEAISVEEEDAVSTEDISETSIVETDDAEEDSTEDDIIEDDIAEQDEIISQAVITDEQDTAEHEQVISQEDISELDAPLASEDTLTVEVSPELQDNQDDETEVEAADSTETDIEALETENILSDAFDGESKSLAEDILTDLEQMAASGVQEETPSVSNELAEESIFENSASTSEITQPDIADAPQAVQSDDTAPPEVDSVAEQEVLERIAQTEQEPEDPELQEQILSNDHPDDEDDIKQKFEKISQELQKVQKVKNEDEDSSLVEESASTSKDETLETEETQSIDDDQAVMSEEQELAEDQALQAEEEAVREQEAVSEGDDGDQTANDLRELSPTKKSALFQ